MKNLDFLKIILISTLVSFYSMADDKGKSAPGALESLKYKSGEEASNDVRAMQTEMLVSKSEELAIKQAQKLIKKYRGMAVEADLQLRLAELYMRRAKSERFFELNRESEFAVKLAPQRVKSASSRTMIVKAVDIYDQIERRFKYFEKIDVVIFNNGFARQQLGQEKTAEKLYWRVIKNHNYSMLVPDSHLAIGEMAFRQKRFKDALLHFEAIKKYPQSRVYPYGLYKAAWTQYNLQRTEVAMKELESVVEFGKRVEEQQLDARLDLRKEALSDMALFYGEVYKPKDAYKYFSRHAKSEEIGDLLMKVSRIYARHGKFGEKDIVLRTFVDENPRDSLIPEIYDQLVWNYEDMKSRPQVVSQLEDFRSLCATNSRWAKGQKGEKAVEQIQGCVRKLQASAIKLAQKWLNLWEKNSSYPEFADSAERAYQIYLADNNDLEKANKARFAYAQLMFQRQKFSPASIEYEKVGRTTAEPQLGHESRYAAILSLEKSIKNNKWTNAEEERFKSLVQLYVTHHPQGKFRLDVEFKVGLIAYEKENFMAAAPIFKRLGEMYAGSEKGLKSQDLYLDILNHNKDYSGLKSYSQILLQQPKGDPKRTLKLQQIFEQAYFLEVQSQEEKGEIKMAIANYHKFVKTNPKSKLAEKALWNAIQLQFKIFDSKGAAISVEKFATLYPKSEHVVPALLRAAQAYESMAQLTRAAKVLEKLSRLDKSAGEKWQSLAADFYAIEGLTNKAQPLYIALKGSKDSNLAFHALEQLEQMAKPGSSTQLKLTEEIIKSGRQPQASLIQLRSVEALFAKGDHSKAFTEAKKVLSMNGNGTEAAKAKARFIQAQILEKEFEQQSVKSRLDRFTTVFAIKTGKLEKAQKAYQAAIEYGEPHVAVESLMRLSKLYGSYVEMLKTMPLPEGLPQTEAPAFQAEMDKLAIPMEEKSVETMADALAQAKKLDLRTGIIPRIQAELDRLNMKTSSSLNDSISVPHPVLPVVRRVGS